jgi:hypothetical protein
MATGYYLIEIFHDKRHQRKSTSLLPKMRLDVYTSPDGTQ